MNLESNFGWLLGLVALVAWVISNSRIKRNFATISQEQQLEATLKQQESRILALEREVETLKGMYYDSQIKIRQYENEINFHKRRADEAEAKLIAMGIAGK